MKIIILLLTIFCLNVNGQNWNETHHATRNYEDSTGFYVIEFDYSFNGCWTTLLWPPEANQTHYPATITVYEIINGKKTIIGCSFEGTYTEKGCYEDDPVSLIKLAKSLNDCIKQEISQSYILNKDSIFENSDTIKLSDWIWIMDTIIE